MNAIGLLYCGRTVVIKSQVNVFMDRMKNQIVDGGTREYSPRRSSNVHWQKALIDKKSRAQLKGQRPRCCWLTGLSGAGKSTIANLVESRLHSLGRHCYLLDGDNVRHGLNRDLGFSDADRVENVRRVGEVARLMVDAGLIVIVAFISPFRSEREQARLLFDKDEFVEVFVDTPLDICERRDPKGLYAKARKGAIQNFTGIDSEYQCPNSPEIHLRTTDFGPEQCADEIMRFIEE